MLYFSRKLRKTFPTIGLLVLKCKTMHQIEGFIARKNNKLHFHNKKWGHFFVKLNWLNPSVLQGLIFRKALNLETREVSQ